MRGDAIPTMDAYPLDKNLNIAIHRRWVTATKRYIADTLACAQKSNVSNDPPQCSMSQKQTPLHPPQRYRDVIVPAKTSNGGPMLKHQFFHAGWPEIQTNSPFQIVSESQRISPYEQHTAAFTLNFPN